ncbi:MAG: hypothetical protein WDO68_04660 [Gammaproteobacteria bacterium]
MTMPASTVLAKDAAPTIDACALLDARDIEKVLGMPVEKGSRRDSGLESNGAYSSACVWMLTAERGHEADPAAPLGGRSFVILNALRWPQGSDGAKSYLQAFREASDSGVLPSKPDARQFGDEALWWGDGLAVRRREVSFGVSVFLPRQAGAQPKTRPGEREERLAKVVLSRLDAQAVERRN